MTTATAISWGDLGAVSRHYVSRPSYAERALDLLTLQVRAYCEDPVVADVGAGTGKLTAMLAEQGLTGYAVEPSEGMSSARPSEGPAVARFEWRRGTAEATTLPDDSVDWVCMGTAFHWTDAPKALSEFHRILRPGGFFTAIWDLNDPKDDALMREVEALIESEAPNLKRVQTNIYRLFENIEAVLQSSGQFSDLVSLTAPHVEEMTPTHYVDMWRSYHDVPSQIGMELWNDLLAQVSQRLQGQDLVETHYRTHAWTVRAV
ncbi:MAG: methyltransferase domain-containing protein [Kiloniellales bacterium]|nr:methyltransferase domain-containing protein [Kiloniellales bacterium]